MSGSADPDRNMPMALLEQWRGLLSRFEDDAHGEKSHARLRAEAEATVARWKWAAARSELHRIEPFVRELELLPEPKLLSEPPQPPANVELYGFGAQDQIALVRTFGSSGDLWWEELLLHAPGAITSILFTMDPPRRTGIRHWQLRDGRVQELLEAPGSDAQEGGESWVSVSRYLYAGERVEQVREQRFELSSGKRIDRSITPTYAPDGRVLELRARETSYEPRQGAESVLYRALYRALPEELPDLAAQRATLTGTLTEVIAEAVIASQPPGQLYGIVLNFGSPMGSGDFLPAVSPLFEARRRYLLKAVEPTGTLQKNSFPPGSEFEYYVDIPLSDLLWDPWTSPEPDEYLPEGVDPEPYDQRVMDDATIGPFKDPDLNLACEHYPRTAALVDRDDGERAGTGLLLDVAARLTELDWNGRLDVTEDFVVLACPYDQSADEVAAALKHSLTPARYADFVVRDWIPSDE